MAAAMLAARDWHKVDGASEAAIAALEAQAQVALPVEYLALLRFSNGGEGPLPVQPFNLLLFPAEEAAEIARVDLAGVDFPGLFVIGGNGGGEAIALDTRSSPPWPVVAYDMTNIDLDESVRLLAPDFASFVALIGLGS